MIHSSYLNSLRGSFQKEDFVSYYGKVKSVRRDSIRVALPGAHVGSVCEVITEGGRRLVEIVSLDSEGHFAMPLDDLGDVSLGNHVRLLASGNSVNVGESLLGKVIDSMGVDLENPQILELKEKQPLFGKLTNPMLRKPVSEAIDLGVRAINSCLTCGRGQRLGIFSGSGVGKSVLLGMLARYTAADVVVIGLIGERGREVREFVERELGPEGRKNTIVVVETAEKSPVRRTRGAYVAAAVSEYFREKGANVLLMVDSLTRFAMAQREIGISSGELPATKGYPPTTFSNMARLVERAGNWGNQGSITGLYTVLVEGDDMEDPVADSARSILDGHIILSRKLANKGHYPSIDILSSISRVMDQVVDPEQVKRARNLKSTLAKFLDNEDAIQYGMYTRGSDSEIDKSIELTPKIWEFLKQEREEQSTILDSKQKLESLLK
jgi:flagellum-specific ATP synthase